MEFRHVERERRRPDELAGLPVKHPDAAGLADRDDHIPLLAALDVRVDPFHRDWIGVDGGANERALMDMIEVPVIARKVLVVPLELPGLDVDRDCRVAVELGRRLARHSVDVAMALPARPRLGIGDAPIEHLANGIIGAGQTPGAGDAPFGRKLAPGITAGFAFGGRVVELPELLAGLGVMRREKAIRASFARAVGDYLAVDHNW